jgi:hypothetical protein
MFPVYYLLGLALQKVVIDFGAKEFQLLRAL